jgi:hypothetical protein
MNDYATGELFALDPSLVKPGAALFRGGKLVAAERVKIDADLKSLPFGERCMRVAESLMRWGMGHNMNPRTLVYELPQFYDSRAGKSKGNPNDLRGLIATANAMAGMLSFAMAARDISLVVLAVEPDEWAGQVPKATTGDPWASPRGVRIKSRLSDDEVTTILPSHDALDAVGIGLHTIGRFAPVRVFPGAT